MKCICAWMVPTLLVLIAITGSRAWAQPEDMCEFATVEDAVAYGWKATSTSGSPALEVTEDAREGRYALKCVGRPGIGNYTTLRLERAIDLSGAGADDTISFWIKQNVKASFCVNMAFSGPVIYNIYRWFSAGEANVWQKVTLDLDLSKWGNPKGEQWGRTVAINIYSSAFDSADEYFILDGLRFNISKPQQAELIVGEDYDLGPGLPALSNLQLAACDKVVLSADANFYYLENDRVRFAILKQDGRVAGGWNKVAGERYLVQAVDGYFWETRERELMVRETEDRFLRVEGEDPLVLTYSNPKLDLVLTKTYRLEGDLLAKDVSFRPAARQEEPAYLTHFSQVILDPEYRKSGTYLGRQELGVVDVPVTASRRAGALDVGSHLLCLVNHRKGYSFAHYLYKVDGKFVLPWGNLWMEKYLFP